MCGIAGILDLTGAPVDRGALARMVTALAHRGPDHAGTWTSGPLGLGHTRLSILDVSAAAHQPFASADGRWQLVYNGELYNFRELRAELADAGVTFTTTGDTEVVLAAFAHWGTDGLARMHGMFAFVIVDTHARRLFAVRDRLGIKPLHWAVRDGRWLFASEVKGILAAVPGGWRCDPGTLPELLLHRERLDTGLLAGLHTLAPGHLLRLSWSDTADPAPPAPVPERWFHVADLPDATLSARLGALPRRRRLDLLDDTLRAAVQRHLVSDVPVGSLCSGGVDSSLMTAMARASRPDIRVYHVDIRDHSERCWAERVARHLDVELNCFVLDRHHYLARYIECIWYNDAPLTHPQNVPITWISELARAQGCRVLLAGEGADEGFGGYDWRYRLRRNYRLWCRHGRWFHRLYRKALFLATGVWLEGFDPARSFRAWADPTDILGHLGDHGGRARLERDCQAAYHFVADPVARETLAAMTADYRDYLNGINHQQDRAAMQAGVESRVPFLDFEVTRLAANLPLADKVTWRTSKRLLKALALRYLPAAVVHRPKIGFASPAADYVLGLGEAPFANGFLVRELGLDLSTIRAMLAADPANYTHMVYGLEFWGRMFLRGEDHRTLTARFVP